jgi:hypothetical protein
VTGHRGVARGLHTGPAYQRSDAARAVDAAAAARPSSAAPRRGEGGGSSRSAELDVGGEGRDGSSALGEGYPLVVGAALDDQMLLASCDFLVAASGHVVTGTSAFARGAAKRGGHGLDSVFATAKPGDGGQCASVSRL